MADPSKTEKATPKRRSESRKKGQVGKSTDASSALSLIAALIALFVAGPACFRRLEATVVTGLAHAGNPQLVSTPSGLSSLGTDAMRTIAYAVAPVALAGLAAG